MHLVGGIVTAGATGAGGWPYALTASGPGASALVLALLLAATAAICGLWAALDRQRMRIAELELAVGVAQAAESQMRAELAEIAAAAHDVRSPLLTMRSYVELLAEGACGRLPAEAAEVARRAVIVAERSQRVVEDALRRATVMVRPSREDAQPLAADAAPSGPGAMAAAAGLVAPESALVASESALVAPQSAVPPVVSAASDERAGRRDLSLAAVVAEVLLSLSAEIEACGARITLGDLPAVRGDRDALFRVFVNLIENALKYGRPGVPPRIEIGGRVRNGRCEVTVRDHGIGIGHDDARRLFAPGERGEHSGDAPGAGLGLATVQRIVEAHDGTVWLDPAVMDGACLRLTLPAASGARVHAAA